MKQRTLLVGCAAVVLLVCTFYFNRTSRTIQTTELMHVAEQPVEVAPQPEPVPQQPSAPLGTTLQPVTTQQMDNEVSEASTLTEEVAPTLRISEGQTLATVNGVPITLKDLVAINPQSTSMPRTMGRDMFNILLNRAVERELAYQAAQAYGVQLNETQTQNLLQFKGREGQTDPTVVDTLGRTPANTEFNLRDAAGLMLLHNLAQAAGVPSPHVSSQDVEHYYQQHRHEYPAFSNDPSIAVAQWHSIDQDIRRKLAPIIRAQRDQGMQRFVEDLKSSANIQ